jgi:hypothetical protein|tara:strand:- start:4043 stop:4243 length:201 start_codon:yes stop_codon:yes gene_type:complete
MAYKIDLRLELLCFDDEESDDELMEMTDYVEDRLNDGASVNSVMQSLAECLIGLADDDIIPEGTMH